LPPILRSGVERGQEVSAMNDILSKLMVLAFAAAVVTLLVRLPALH
jgi:hypothetical protein